VAGAAIMIIVFVIGLPVGALLLLYKHRKAITNLEDIRELRFLYTGYKSRTMWWYISFLGISQFFRELMFLAKKLGIVLCAVFLG
jgi:hypothetical protein